MKKRNDFIFYLLSDESILLMRPLFILFFVVVLSPENKTEPIFVEDSPNVTLSCGISVDQPVKSVTWSKVERKDGVKILNPIKDLKDFSYSEKSDNAVSSLIISNPSMVICNCSVTIVLLSH